MKIDLKTVRLKIYSLLFIALICGPEMSAYYHSCPEKYLCNSSNNLPSRETPLFSSQQLGRNFTGADLKWVILNNHENMVDGLPEVQMDFDLRKQLPKNSIELEALIERRNGERSLPILVNGSTYFSALNLNGHSMFLTALRETKQGLMADLVYSVLTPEDQVLHFSGRNIPIAGMGNDFCQLNLALDEEQQINDAEFPITIKGSLDPDSASYVSFNCDGFDKFQLRCEYKFPESLVTPVAAGTGRVKATFNIVSTRLGDFIGTVNVNPFMINGLDDVTFQITDAIVDYSTGHNFEGMEEAIGMDWPAALKTKYQDNTWRGFFMKSLSIGLPEGLANTSGGRIFISVSDLIADHGSGISAKFAANPNVGANAAGWGITLDELLLEVISNSIHQFKLIGNINIPIMEGSSGYQAMFSVPPNSPDGRAEVSFNLSLDGTYNIPFLNKSKVELNNSSVAGINYINGKFQPHATLHGNIQVGITSPAITLPALEFQDLKINDSTLPSHGGGPGKVTGGLDRISVGAFGFSGINLSGGGATGYNYPEEGFIDFLDNDPGKMAHGPNSMYKEQPPVVSENEDSGTGGGNQKLGGFPITIRNIAFDKAQDGETSCYKLNFNIGVNFAKGVNTFQSEGSFAIWGGLDFSKMMSLKPWEALSYKKTSVESILIEADLGKVAIAGGIRLIDDDPIYGSGFKGAISMEVKLPAAEFVVQSVGQFGSIPADGTNEDYRYFFVDAEVGFSQGLQLGNTGLAVFGFSGGFFYNMERSGTDPEALAAGKNVSTMPTNNQVDMTSQLLQPGITLSGAQYIPAQDKTSFKAGMIFGLSVPQTLLADAAFGMDINTSSGFAVEKIYFTGGAYLMNQGIADRQKGAAVLKLKLEMDLLNNELVGNFGMKYNVPTGVPAESAIITGNYNMSLNAVNVYFKFKGQKEYFFYAGTPDEPMKINFQLSSLIKLGSINAYFMVGTKMPAIPTLASIFAEEGFNLPSQLHSIAGRGFMPGDRGIAFGARLKVPRKTYSFLMFRSTIQAMAGFDASMMHIEDDVDCGSNGTFGMNNWYLQGQAYGAFYGALSMKINLLFYSGTVKIAELEAGAALQAKLPNPTWMMGFIYGRYSVLGGRIKGKFSFKVEMGEQCTELPEYDPLASIPLIQDLFPADNGQVEVYDNPSATFFVPMGQYMTVPITQSNGSIDYKYYKCYLNTSHTKITKKGSTVAIPMDISYQDSFNTATFKPQNLLDPNTEYQLTVRVNWNELKNGQVIPSAVFEEKIVKFKTGNMPRKIVAEAVGYHAPGLNQKYWHKNYARPMLEFKQEGWANLFPSTKLIKFNSGDQNIISAFRGAGWNTNMIGNVTEISKTIQLKYVCRVKNLRTNLISDIELNGYPGQNENIEIAYVAEKGIVDGYSNMFTVKVIEHATSSGKIVRFDGLNNINLNKEDIYSLEIVQQPAETIQLPVTTALVESTESMMYNDTMEVYTQELSTREIVPLDQFRQAIQQVMGEEILYTNYHFGVSKYSHIRYKFYDVVNTGNQNGSLRHDFGHPDSRLLQIKFAKPTYDHYYAFTNPVEPFDHYDEIYLRNNLKYRSDGVYGNPVRDYLLHHRMAIEMIDLVGDRANSNVRNMRSKLNKNDNAAQILRNELNVAERAVQGTSMPHDLYNPINDDNKLYTGQTGVSILADNSPSFWYKFKNTRLNDDQESTRISEMQYKEFISHMTGDYMNVPGWAFQLHFNTGVNNLLTQTEITNKAMKEWGPGKYPQNYSVPGGVNSAGSNVMWVQNSDARILRNMLQLYSYQAKCMDMLTDALVVSKVRINLYRLIRNYYVFGNHSTFSQVLNDAYGDGRMELLNIKKIGLKLRFSNNEVPEYIHSPGTQDGNTREANLRTSAYILD